MNNNNFDWKFYISFYPDLSKLKNEKNAYDHWNEFGKYENRICSKESLNNLIPKDFDWKFYTTYYKDLSHIKDKYDAYTHWIKNKSTENRIYNKMQSVEYKKKDNLLNTIIHNSVDYLKTINSAKSDKKKTTANLSSIRIALDIIPTKHKDYMARGVGSLIADYIKILNRNNIAWHELDCKNFEYANNNKYNIVHFTAPPIINSKYSSDDKCTGSVKLMKLMIDQKKSNTCYIIITIYDIIPYLFPESYMPGDIYYEFCKKVKDVDLVVAISGSTKDDLVRHLNVPEDKIYVVYPTIRDCFKYLPDLSGSEHIIKKLKIIKKFILCPGGEDGRKNLPETVNGFLIAVKKYNITDTQLVVACSLSERYIQNMKNMLGEFKDLVVFTGFISDNELNILYNRAYVTLFASIYEGFGLPIIESIKCHTPVICSITSSMLELIQLSDGGIVPTNPYSRESIAESIKYIFTIDTVSYQTHVDKSLMLLKYLYSSNILDAYKYVLNKYS